MKKRNSSNLTKIIGIILKVVLLQITTLLVLDLIPQTKQASNASIKFYSEITPFSQITIKNAIYTINDPIRKFLSE